MEQEPWIKEVEAIGVAFGKDIQVSFEAHMKAASEKLPVNEKFKGN